MSRSVSIIKLPNLVLCFEHVWSLLMAPEELLAPAEVPDLLFHALTSKTGHLLSVRSQDGLRKARDLLRTTDDTVSRMGGKST